MDTQTRRRIAYVAGRLAKLNTAAGSIYDFQSGQHYFISGDITHSNVAIFDYTTSSHMSGGGDGSGGYNLFDYSNSQYIDFKYKEGTFEGFDYASGSHFNGKASINGEVGIFDYSTGQYYSFTV